MRSLHADGRSRRAIWFLLIPAVVLAAWTAWFLGARISCYEVTGRARLEVDPTASLGPGGHVAAGDKLGVIIPSAKPRVIAEFTPSSSLGRIRAGQPAHLRIQGFGSIPAHVTSAAGYVRDGTVRVELAVDPSTTSMPLQNGLTCTVEVQVESVSPATLLLRAAGMASFNRQTQ